MRLIDKTGMSFDRLTVISRAENTDIGHTRWNCICTCGNTLVRPGSDLTKKGKKIQACNDCVIQSKTKHGKSNTRVHNIWMRMLQRTTNKDCEDYTKYGYGEVGVCPTWLNFENFYADMGEPPTDKHSIDRINGKKGYSKDNCRWATSTEQSRNKSNNKLITYKGETRCLAEWCELLNLPYLKTWQNLYRKNLPPEKAFSKF